MSLSSGMTRKVAGHACASGHKEGSQRASGAAGYRRREEREQCSARFFQRADGLVRAGFGSAGRGKGRGTGGFERRFSIGIATGYSL